MWGRNKIFRLSMIFQLRNCKNKISLSHFFLTHPLSGINAGSHGGGKAVGHGHGGGGGADQGGRRETV